MPVTVTQLHQRHQAQQQYQPHGHAANIAQLQPVAGFIQRAQQESPQPPQNRRTTADIRAGCGSQERPVRHSPHQCAASVMGVCIGSQIEDRIPSLQSIQPSAHREQNQQARAMPVSAASWNTRLCALLYRPLILARLQYRQQLKMMPGKLPETHPQPRRLHKHQTRFAPEIQANCRLSHWRQTGAARCRRCCQLRP